jgi:hypothetical protein
VHDRQLQWTLIRCGASLLDRCRRPVMALERRLMAGLSATAQATVTALAVQIAAELQQDS